MTLTTAVDKFVHAKGSATRRRRPASPATMIAYKQHLMGFVRWVLVTQRRESVQLFTAQLAAEYLDFRSTQSISEHTRSVDSVALRELASWGLDQRLWSEDRVRLSQIPVVLKPPTMPRPYGDAERERMLALEIPLEDQVLRGLLFFAGLRRAEATGLLLQHITPPHVMPDGTPIMGRLTVWGKGGKPRTVPIHPGFWPVLETYLKTRAGDHLDRPLLIRDGHKWGEQMVARRVRDWGAAAKVADAKAHRARHSFGTRLYEATGDLRVVQELLGHSSPATTAIYTKVVDRRRDAAISKAFGAETSGHDSRTLGMGEGAGVENPTETQGQT